MTRQVSPQGVEDPAPAQTDLLIPFRCPCGELPIVQEDLIYNWCRCVDLVAFNTIPEWNAWATR